jgi:hypothetical protein
MSDSKGSGSHRKIRRKLSQLMKENKSIEACGRLFQPVTESKSAEVINTSHASKASTQIRMPNSRDRYAKNRRKKSFEVMTECQVTEVTNRTQMHLAQNSESCNWIRMPNAIEARHSTQMRPGQEMKWGSRSGVNC